MTFDENQSGYDVVIVGGGVSGSFIADELSRAGLRCVMLEAGAHLDRETYPRREIDAHAQLYWGGGIELARDGRIGFLRPKVVGGGSVVSRAVLERFDDLAFDAWREVSGVSFCTRPALEPWYDRVAERISIQAVPEGYRNGNAEIFRQGCERNGYRYVPVQRAVRDCRYQDGNCCIECLMGCRIGSKQSTPVTVLPRALEAGLALVPQFAAERVIAEVDEVAVTGRTASGARSTFRGRRLVLAAGAIGNARLLLNSPLASSLPALGHHFYVHPQSMVLGRYDEPVGAHFGPLQSYTSDEPTFRRGGFKLDNVFAPPVALAMQVPGFGAAHQRLMRDITHLAGIEVVVRDTEPGRIHLDHVEKRLNADDHRRREQGVQAVRNIFASTGVREVVEGQMVLGQHLMGGCVLGTDPAVSVTSPSFQLHGCPNVYAADSSIFPNAPGLNPAFTVMALSLMAAERILEDARA